MLTLHIDESEKLTWINMTDCVGAYWLTFDQSCATQVFFDQLDGYVSVDVL